MMYFFKRNLGVCIILIIVCAILSPYLLTRSWIGISFIDTGGIGETINGLMSPILNILTIFLLYLTLKEQFNSNKDLKIIEMNNRDYQITYEMLSKIDKDFDKISLVIQQREFEKIYLGSKAFIAFKELLNVERILNMPISKDDWIDFQLGVNYLITQLHIVLKKNYTNSLKMEEKSLVFNSLEKYIYFLLELKELLNFYKKKVVGKNLSELEALIFEEEIDVHNYIKDFNIYRPKNEIL